MKKNAKPKWRTIKGYSHYQVSNDGRVRSNFKGKWKILKPNIHEWGYSSFELCNGAKDHKRLSLHRLIAEAFIGKIPEGYHVAHLDGNPGNNHLKNLIICTVKENASHTALHKTRLYGENQGNARLTNNQVREIRKTWKPFIVPKTALAARYKVSVSTIKNILYNKQWKTIK